MVLNCLCKRDSLPTNTSATATQVARLLQGGAKRPLGISREVMGSRGAKEYTTDAMIRLGVPDHLRCFWAKNRVGGHFLM